MKQDKALKKVFSKPQDKSLPYGFDMRIMREVTKAAEKKQRKATLISYLSVSFASLCLIVGTIILLRFYFDTPALFEGMSLKIDEGNRQVLCFSLFIGGIALLVLMLDLLLRKMLNKRHAS